VGGAELNHLLIRLIFPNRDFTLGFVGNRHVGNLLALNVSMDRVIAPFMDLMLSVDVDLRSEQLMPSVMAMRGQCCPDERQHARRGNGGGEDTASAIHETLLSGPHSECRITVALLRWGKVLCKRLLSDIVE